MFQQLTQTVRNHIQALNADNDEIRDLMKEGEDKTK